MRRGETDKQLRARARRSGWVGTFTDGLGQLRQTPIDALRALVSATDESTPQARSSHRQAGDEEAPRRIPGSSRKLALFLPLHAVRSPWLTGVGTYTDLGSLVEWSRDSAQALMGTLPLFPSFYDHLFDPSPYAPISRLFWNELHVDPAAAPEFQASPVRRLITPPAFKRAAARSREGDWVNHALAWKLQRSVLGRMAAVAHSRPARWREIQKLAGPDAADYALFRANIERTGKGWRSWSTPRINPRDLDPAATCLYLYAQALANQQMRRVASLGCETSPLYLDLPVGVHPEGFDTWRSPQLFLSNVSAGAPADDLNAHGQVWGFPPMHPRAGRADGHAHLRAVLRRMFAVAGVLRIDHVMWLHRIYCVPTGFDGAAGAYLTFPARELYDIVLSEAVRANASIVGEDLGTVPPIVRSTMRRRGLLRMHVQQFLLRPDPRDAIVPAEPDTLACLNTHDMPPFAGFWKGHDITLRQRLGLVTAAVARRERARRARVRAAVTRALTRSGLAARTARQVAISLMRLHASSAAAIQLINLEDLLGETRPQNVPGTSKEYPNWRRRARSSLVDLLSKSALTAAISGLAGERRMAGSAHPGNPRR